LLSRLSFILLLLAARAKIYRAEAVIELSAPLWLGPEFLGLLKPARIGGVEVHVVLPDFKRGITEVGTVLHSRAQMDWVEFFRKEDPEHEQPWSFGGVSRRKKGSGGILEFSAHRLLVLPKGAITRAEARKFKAVVDDWVQQFEMWIEVIAREDLHREQVWVERQGRSAVVWLDQGKAPKGEFLPGKNRVMVHFRSALEITPRQWGKALSKASDGATPSEAHLLLRDARHAKNVGHYRRSVLDSATAAELALAKLRDDALAGSRGALQGYVRGKARQIEGLCQFLAAMGITLPRRIREEISEPRNIAIHAGRELDDETAGRALEKSEEIVNLAFPWKKLL